MFGFLGFIGAGIFAYNFFKDANINNDYTDMSKDNAKKNKSPIYYDTRGHIYETNTGRRCMRWTDIATGDQLLKDVRTGAVLRNLTREENNRKTRESLEEAKKNGYPFYVKYGEKVGNRVVWTVDGDQIYVVAPSMDYKELGGKIATWYQPARIDEKMTKALGKPYYKYDKSRDKEDTWVRIHNEGYRKFTWREWNKIIQNTMPVYVDSLNNWENNMPEFEDGFYLAYDRKTDEPYAVKKNDYSRTGVGEMWRLYDDGKGGYIRETKWYYLSFIHETRRIRRV